ncbi:dihydropteroate synthase [Fibrobacteres bacterium R8-0-B4]
MGIVNVTENSFYDGGRYITKDAAVEHALRLVDEGADVIDVGGCSSRPGSEFLPPEEEAGRVAPVISELVKRGIRVPISIDTVWSSVAEAAIGAGATWINDIAAGRIDPKMPGVAASNPQCAVVLMHSRGTPDTMQENPKYEDVVNEVVSELSSSIDMFLQTGVSKDKIIADPGFGFAKDTGHNIELLRGLDKVVSMGYPVLAGLSRKSFIGAITNRPVNDRLPGTLAATEAAYRQGAKIFRVHDVKETVDFLKVLSTVL